MIEESSQPRIDKSVERPGGPDVPTRPAGVHGRRVLWPVAIGAVSVALGAYRAMSGIEQAADLLVGYLVNGGDFLQHGSQIFLAFYGIQLLKGVLAGALLLPAGLLLWRQSRPSITMHIIWAILAILLEAAWPFLAAIVLAAFMNPAVAVPMILRATVELIYPVFLLVWLLRGKARDEIRLW